MEVSKKKLIVVVEDEEIILKLLTKKLVSAGYEVKSAKDGVAGLELIKKANPDLLLLDMMLPVKDGYWILEQLNAEHILPKLSVIIISNSGQPVEVDRALKLGVKDYLIKVNFDPEDVLQKVNRLFEVEGLDGGLRMKAASPHFDPPAPENKSIGHILIVEDDLFILELLSGKLRQLDFKISIANDTKVARKILELEKIDLMLLDILLPGEDGFTFLKELKDKAAFKSIPVIILSNLGQKEEQEKGLSFGAVDYLIKANSSPTEIVDHIRKVLGK